MRAGGVGFRDRPVAADCCYTIGGMLQVEVNYADAYPRQIPSEAGDMLQKLPLSLASAAVYPRVLQPRREIPSDELLQPQDVFLVGVGQLPTHLRREWRRLD